QPIPEPIPLFHIIAIVLRYFSVPSVWPAGVWGGGGAGCEAWRSVWRPWIGIGTEGLGVEQHVQDSAIASNGRLLRGWIDIFSSSYSLLVLTGTPPII